MADSQFRLIGRGLGVLAAASLLAGVSLDAGASDATKRLALQTGKTLDAFRIDYEEKDSLGVWAPPPGENTVLPQLLSGTGCTFTLTGPDYLGLKPGGGRGELGWVATSIGVYDGPRGTGCGRISADKRESLEVVLGTTRPSSYFAFDRIELDLEVKGDVRVLVEVKFGNSVTKYYLKAGAGQVLGSPDEINKVLTPSDNTYKCSASSDSGPDSGPSDNCRLIIEDLGQSFKITTEVGEISLEGGSDFTDVKSSRTFIYLTEPDGDLVCGETIEQGDTDGMYCAITRLDDPNATSACKAVPYIFRTVGNSCVLSSDMQGQQLVANLFISYDPEDSVAPSLALDDLTVWLPSSLSRVSFDNDASGSTYQIPQCLGLTLTNIDLGATPPAGPDPIPEIASGIYDRIQGNDTIEFACAFMRQEIYGSDSLLNPKTRVHEGIQFWGDIKFERF